MTVYTSIKDLPKDINKSYFYENHNRNGEKGMIVTVSNVSTDHDGSFYTFDYKSKLDGSIRFFFIFASNSNNSYPFPTLTEDKTWEKWTEI